MPAKRSHTVRHAKEIATYKTVLADKLESDEVMALGQPAFPGLSVFKIFAFLLGRIAALETPAQDLVNRLVEERLAVVTAELDKKWTERINAARIRRMGIS
jgi:hypothetical protein